MEVGIDRRAAAGVLQALLLGAAIVLLFLVENLEGSSFCVVLWLLIGLLLRAGDRPWSLMVLGMLMLNVRPVVMNEGPVPVSPMDYVLMLAAFLCGHGRSPRWWLRNASIVAVATLIGVLLHLEIVVDFARFGIEYHIAALTKNQTALLAGFASLCSLVALLAFRAPFWRLLHGLSLLGAGVLLRAADSRAGIGTVLLAVLLGGLAVLAPRLLPAWRRRFGPVRRGILIAVTGGIALAAVLWLLLQMFAELPLQEAAGGIDRFYGEENLENDASRLRVYACYLGLPFTGDNRFIWGVGYEKAWRIWCTAEQVGRPLSHAHNLILQVWGESGVAGAVFLLGWLGWILNRVVRNARLLPPGGGGLMVFASTAFVAYQLLFHLFELGMVKVPLLLLLFGLFLASPFQDKHLGSGDGSAGLGDPRVADPPVPIG